MGVLARLYNTVVDMTKRLDKLSGISSWTWIEELAVLHALQIQAQALLDMLMRFAAELGYTPTTPREAAEILLKEKILSREDYELVRRIQGFKNILVHEYVAIDMKLVEKIVREKEYHKTLLLATALVEKSSKQGIDP